MSLLTEQEIRSIMRSVKEIGENSDRALIIAAESAVIAKIKAQGAVAVITEMSICGIPSTQCIDWVKEAKLGETLYRISEGD